MSPDTSRPTAAPAPLTRAARRPVDGFAVTFMVMLCASWGLQQVAIKVTAVDVHPVMQMTIRSGIAALLLTPIVWRQAGGFGLRDGTWRPGLVVGILFGLEFLAIAEALARTTASHVAVFLYTAPVFTALGLQVLLRTERLAAIQWAGIALAFSGIAIAFLGGGTAGQDMSGGGVTSVEGDLLALLAGALWGATTVVIRLTSLSETPAARTLHFQLAAAFVIIGAAAIVNGQTTIVSLSALSAASIVYQGVIVAFLTYLGWFWMLRRYAAAEVAVLSFMTPLFGVSFGVILLGEPIDAAFGWGAALVIAGVVLVSGGRLLLRRLGRVAR
ncbi:MAG: DMT family transporter [Azospirillaceae bacterium]